MTKKRRVDNPQKKRRDGLKAAGLQSIPVNHLDKQTIELLNRLSKKLDYKDPKLHERTRSWTYSNVITYLVRESSEEIELNPKSRATQELFRYHRIVKELTKKKKSQDEKVYTDEEAASFMIEHNYSRPSIFGDNKNGWTAKDIKRLKSNNKVKDMVKTIDDIED